MKLFWPINTDFEQVMEVLQTHKPNTPFAEDLLAFTQSLSKRLVKLRHLPEVVALGYWLRKANIAQMQQQFEASNAGKFVRARGLVFHIAPSNVDTIFVYSWMLSLLAGNKNVIRISSKAEVNELLQVVLKEIAKFEAVASTTMICTYSHEEKATAALSAACHTRVIWGGDETVKAIRQVPLAPLANELAFPDRFSLAVFNSERVRELNEVELDLLLEKFYNDVFWFDQLACSSPRLVVWLGEAVPVFWSRFEQKIKQKNYELFASTQVLKYTTSLQLAAESYIEKVKPTTYFSRVQLQSVPANVREQHCGGGLFYEHEVEVLSDLANIVIDKDQTLAYYGFEKSELSELAMTIQTRGLDRIVPVGQALDFSGIWDGQNFLTSFTREVVII